MPTEKDGFVMYKSEYESIEYLSDQDLGSLTRAIYKYQISGEIPPKSNPLVFGVFMFFKVKFDRDDARYAKVVERNQKNGQKGGRPPAPNNQDVESNPAKPKEPTGFSGMPDNPTEPKEPDKEKEQDTGKEKGSLKKEETVLPHGVAFKESWNNWGVHRKEKKSSLTPTTIKAQLSALSKLSEADAVATINHSIKNGYTGLFPESINNNSKNGKSNNQRKPGSLYSTAKAPPEYRGLGTTCDVEL